MFFLFLFDANNVSATNLFKKVTVKGDGSNNSGVEPQAAGSQWGLLRRFSSFFLNKAFLCIFWSKFLLKKFFK